MANSDPQTGQSLDNTVPAGDVSQTPGATNVTKSTIPTPVVPTVPKVVTPATSTIPTPPVTTKVVSTDSGMTTPPANTTPPPSAPPANPLPPLQPPATTGAPTTPAPGIVNTGTNGPGAPVNPGAPYMPTATQGTVTQDQTVQGQLGSILQSGSPLLEAAKARAAQAANARGLQNSSMATQAGEEAVVNTALPIAQQDAQAYQRQSLANQDVLNQFKTMKFANDADLNKAYQQFVQQGFLQDKDLSLKKYINDTSNTTQEKVAAMSAAANVEAASIHANAQIEATNAQVAGNLKVAGLQADTSKYQIDATSASNLAVLKQNAVNNYSSGLVTIMSSPMEPDAKSNALKNYNATWAGNPYLPFTITI